ncbi:ArsR/SmtB family transcription factor [Streptomyces sp. NPDC050161]|uniref:ArsR/SmtB family transcription factor n=1 Tax=Streptomyces sp. NPDC050161 TaxID=3365604 RepID=UPI003792B34B
MAREDRELGEYALPVLVYPVLRNPGSTRRPGPIERAESRYLTELLGGTRSQILRLAADGPTTTELGCRAGVSVATASRHAAALRNAGLTTCRRHRSTVTHHLTSLGAALLNGTPEPEGER